MNVGFKGREVEADGANGWCVCVCVCVVRWLLTVSKRERALPRVKP